MFLPCARRGFIYQFHLKVLGIFGWYASTKDLKKKYPTGTPLHACLTALRQLAETSTACFRSEEYAHCEKHNQWTLNTRNSYLPLSRGGGPRWNTAVYGSSCLDILELWPLKTYGKKFYRPKQTSTYMYVPM